MQISIIIPVLNEIDVIQHRIADFNTLITEGHQLIFVDGGSADGSYEFLVERFENVCLSARGRALQMNKGASLATGDLLVFLHVDTVFDESSLSSLREGKFRWGFFTLCLSGSGPVYRIIERCIQFRSRIFCVATGDQTLFFEREFFGQLGGFPDIELMEDVEMSRLAKRVSKPNILDQLVTSSSRRWERNGPIRTILFMWYLQVLYKLGIRTSTLAEMYRSGKWLDLGLGNT